MFDELTSVQWLLIVAFIVGGIVAVEVLLRIIAVAIRWILRKVHIEPNPALAKAVARSIALGVVTEVINLLLPFMELKKQWLANVELWLNTLAVVFLIIAAYRLVDLVCHRIVVYTLRHRTHARDAAKTLAPLVASAFKAVIVIIGITVSLGMLGVNVAALLTGLSIGGAAIALASQDTIRNLIGSVTILADQPFVVGDWIVTQGADGIVEEIGFRSTRIRTLADSVVSLPNGRLADLTVENLGIRNYRRFRSQIMIEHATPHALVKQFIGGIEEAIIRHPLTVKSKERVTVALTEITAVGFLVTVVMFVEAQKITNENAFRGEMNLLFIEIASQLGVTWARVGDPG